MSSTNQFLSIFNIRVDKITNETAFLMRICTCLANARTNQARQRLYQAALIRVNYGWMQYVDKITA